MSAPTREEMRNVGYHFNGITWESPVSGLVLSFEQARAEYAQAREQASHDDETDPRWEAAENPPL